MGVEVHFWELCVKIVEWCPSTYNCKKLRDFIIHGPQGSENLEKSLHASCKAKTQQGTRSVNTLWHCIRKCNLKLYAKQKPFMNTLGLSSSKIDWCKVEKCRWASCPLGFMSSGPEKKDHPDRYGCKVQSQHMWCMGAVFVPKRYRPILEEHKLPPKQRHSWTLLLISMPNNILHVLQLLGFVVKEWGY